LSPARRTADTPFRSLRILIANERKDRLARIAEIVTGLGHEVISRELEVSEVAEATEREQPDLAFVGLGVSGEHALDMISEIVREASCPVIALLEADDPVWVNEAAKRGIFAYIVDGNPQEMQSAIDITLRRYAEYASLEGAFARRAVIERAKGIMMSSQEIDERRAFELLRTQSQRSGRKVYDVAQAVVDSHLLLVRREREV
jgi:AmiR/NasT family two-component response regulator